MYAFVRKYYHKRGNAVILPFYQLLGNPNLPFHLNFRPPVAEHLEDKVETGSTFSSACYTVAAKHVSWWPPTYSNKRSQVALCWIRGPGSHHPGLELFLTFSKLHFISPKSTAMLSRNTWHVACKLLTKNKILKNSHVVCQESQPQSAR